MNITLKDSKGQHRWGYAGVEHIDIDLNFIRIRGYDSLTHEDYSFRHELEEVDSIELEKSEVEHE